MEQRTYQPKRHSTAVRRNTDLQARLYKEITLFNTVKQVTPAIQPNTQAAFIFPEVVKSPPNSQGLKPTKIIEVPDGFVTSAENVYRTRKHLLFTVTLMNGRKGQVVSLKPAVGSLYRQPDKLIAVLYDVETGHREDVEIKAYQPLKVVI